MVGTPLEETPAPSDPGEAALAQSLGMVVIQGMRDIEEIEKFSASIGEFNAQISGPDDTMWLIRVTRI